MSDQRDVRQDEMAGEEGWRDDDAGPTSTSGIDSDIKDDDHLEDDELEDDADLDDGNLEEEDPDDEAESGAGYGNNAEVPLIPD